MHHLLKNSIERFNGASDQEKEFLISQLKEQAKLDPEEIRARYLMSKSEYLLMIKELQQLIKKTYVRAT